MLSDVHGSFFASENDTNALVRATRFAMRLAHTPPARGILLPDLKARSQDKSDYFWLGDSDPETVRRSHSRMASRLTHAPA